MQKISTPMKWEMRNSTKKIGPKQSTINLVKQFARIYLYNETLQTGLRNFIPN